MDAISSQSTEVEKYITYTGGAREDKVVFTSVPFDVYYYKILSSPVATEVGEMLTINVPLRPVSELVGDALAVAMEVQDRGRSGGSRPSAAVPFPRLAPLRNIALR